MLEVPAVTELLHQVLQRDITFDLHCPEAAPSAGVLELHLPPVVQALQQAQVLLSAACFWPVHAAVSAVQIALPWAGGNICSHCGEGSLAVELHVVHECPLLQPLRQLLYLHQRQTLGGLFLGQKDHMQLSSYS